MSQNQAAAITQLKDILFSQEEIVKIVKEREQIFEIVDSKQVSLGFVSLYDLKAYIFEYQEEGNNYQIKNIDRADWTPIFEHTLFQRRRPQLVSAATLNSSETSSDDQKFFILKHGQKSGPYEKHELSAMLENKELLLTDMVSSNAGHTWTKLYQIENFERRTLKESDKLPGVPSKVIAHANEFVISITPETEAVSSLAYLSNVRRGKSVERDKIEIYHEGTLTSGKSSSLYKWLLIGSIVGIGYFLFHIAGQLDSPFSEEQVVGEQAQMLTPIEGDSPIGERRSPAQINDQRRNSNKFDTRALNPIRPLRPNQRKSFMETGKYQEIQNSNNAQQEDDPNYFYDNTSPMELDPVRSQVSKENFDDTPPPEGTPETNPEPIPSADATFESEVSN